MFSRIEQKTGTTISNGRMDQYFFPFYAKDRAEGKINDAQAMELLECMWVDSKRQRGVSRSRKPQR